jgi:hypothetical protein
MGWISDRSNLRTAFLAVTAAAALSALILFWGIRKAPDLNLTKEAHGAVQA